MERLIKNKKAIEVFSPILFFLGFLPVVLLLLTGHSNKQSEINLDFIGKNQILIKQIYEKAENDLFFNDQLAKYASWDSIYNLANQGGFADTNCPRYAFYCIIDPNSLNYEENFKKLFNNSFNDNFKIYFNQTSDYITAVKDNLVVGISKINLNYSRANNTINYQIKPHFEIKLDYNFSDYEVILENSKKLITECYDKTPLKECINETIKNFKQNDLTWQLGRCDNPDTHVTDKAAFCVFHSPKKIIYTKDGEKTILYKFALEFKK